MKITHKCEQFVEINKIEPQEDGTLIVAGIASDESRDADGEIIKADSIKAVLPDFMRYGTGNLREMHQLSAVGTVIEATVNEKGETHIVTKVVDPVAVMKVKHGVYKGFSIRGKGVTEAANPKIVHMRSMSEISLVDRPNNGNSIFTVIKIEDGKDIEDDTSSETFGIPKARLIELAKAEAAAVMKQNPLRAALAALASNVLLAHTIKGCEVIKALAANEAHFIGDDAKLRQDVLEATDKLSAALIAMAPTTIQADVVKVLTSHDDNPAETELVDIKKALGSKAVTGVLKPQEVIKALFDEKTALEVEVSKVQEAGKAFGMEGDIDVEKFIEKVFGKIKELSELPGVAKGVTKVISKADDGGQETSNEIKPVTMGASDLNKIATEIKKVHAAGGSSIDPRYEK